MVFTTQLEVVNTVNLGTAYALALAPSLDRSSNSLWGSQFPPHSAGFVFLGSTSEQLLASTGSFRGLAEPFAFWGLLSIEGPVTRADCHSCLPRIATEVEDDQHLPGWSAAPRGAQHLLGLSGNRKRTIECYQGTTSRIKPRAGRQLSLMSCIWWCWGERTFWKRLMALEHTVQAPAQVGMTFNFNLQHCVRALFDLSSFCHSLTWRCPSSTYRCAPHPTGMHFICSGLALVSSARSGVAVPDQTRKPGPV